MPIKWKDLLYHGKRQAVTDERNFKAWEKKEIDTEECLIRFLDNNKWDVESYVIDSGVLKNFERWLNSLGYYRGTYDTPEAYYEALSAKEEK